MMVTQVKQLMYSIVFVAIILFVVSSVSAIELSVLNESMDVGYFSSTANMSLCVLNASNYTGNVTYSIESYDMLIDNSTVKLINAQGPGDVGKILNATVFVIDESNATSNVSFIVNVIDDTAPELSGVWNELDRRSDENTYAIGVGGMNIEYQYSDPENSSCADMELQLQELNESEWIAVHNFTVADCVGNVTMPVEYHRRGDVLRVRARVLVGPVGSLTWSDWVPSSQWTVQNGLPYVTGLQVSPQSPRSDLDLTVEYTFNDPDGDLDDSLVEWIVGDYVFTTDTTLSARNLSGNENVTVRITPRDGTEVGDIVNMTVWVTRAAPRIRNVYCEDIYPNEADSPTVAMMPVEFTVGSPEGFIDVIHGVRVSLKDSSVNASCDFSQVDEVTREYVCGMPIHYWYAPGVYDISINFTSFDVGATYSDSAECVVGRLIASRQVSFAAAFTDAAPGSGYVRSDESIIIENTGNVDLEFFMKAYSLVGVNDRTHVIDAADFRAGSALSGSVSLNHNQTVKLKSALSAGESSSSDIWMWLSMDSGLEVQPYGSDLPWQLTVGGVQ